VVLVYNKVNIKAVDVGARSVAWDDETDENAPEHS
jgi:hypothetical protein